MTCQRNHRGTVGSKLLPFLFAASLFTLGAPAVAQTLDAPAHICAGEMFEVDWTGPNGSGDRVTIAVSTSQADEDVGSSNTADGNPAALRAPFQTGTYKLRYLHNETQAILVDRNIEVRNCSTSSGGQSGGNEVPIPRQAVLVTGTQIEYGETIDTNIEGPFGPSAYTLDALCNASPQLAGQFRTIVGQLESAMTTADSPVTFTTIENLPGAPSRAQIAGDMATARDVLCDQPAPRTTVQPFVISYASCRMTMATPQNAMDIHLPPGGGNGTMSLADHLERQVIKMTLRPNIQAVNAVAGAGWDNGIEMTSTGQTGTQAGHRVRQYNFEYSGGLGGGNSGMSMIANMVSVKNEGTAWMADNVPGIEIVQSFYRGLTQEMSLGDGTASFFGGLISNVVSMLEYGLPLDIEQTTTSGITGAGSMAEGRSRNFVSSVRVVNIQPDWCLESVMPANYAVTDIDQQVSELLGGSGMNSPEVQDAMREAQAAMEQMAPEQRQMMEQFGLGDMMGQMSGGAAAASAASGSASPGTPAGSNSGPSSADLMTDDLTETAQNLLQALGYDPGESNGTASLQTTIAISQFQADKGLAATGEVTPQLIGILAAEVDSRP